MQPDTKQQNQSNAGWQFNPGQQSSQSSQSSNNSSAVLTDQDQSQSIDMPEAESRVLVSWTASEFIAYQKDATWYLGAFLVLAVLAGLSYLITRGDLISVMVIVVIGGLFISFASRQPRVLTYEVTSKGIRIGEKLYAYSTIKSFAVIDIGNIRSIDLIPLQRFKPSISMLFDPKDEVVIIQALGNYLPKENRQQASIDKLMHKIRF